MSVDRGNAPADLQKTEPPGSVFCTMGRWTMSLMRFTGCGQQSIYATFKLDSTGSGMATVQFHGQCHDSTSTDLPCDSIPEPGRVAEERTCPAVSLAGGTLSSRSRRAVRCSALWTWILAIQATSLREQLSVKSRSGEASVNAGQSFAPSPS